MKNFNIFVFHWKIWLLGGGAQKTNIEGGCPKRGLEQFADLVGAWQERSDVFEWGVHNPMHNTIISFKKGLFLLSRSNTQILQYWDKVKLSSACYFFVQ